MAPKVVSSLVLVQEEWMKNQLLAVMVRFIPWIREGKRKIDSAGCPIFFHLQKG
jgi:hypothetical protein